MATLVAARSSLVWPGSCLAPAVTITIDEPAVTPMEFPDPGDRAGGYELAAVVQVEDLGVDLLGVGVEERDRTGRSTDQAGVGDGRPDAAYPDDGNLGTGLLMHHVSIPQGVRQRQHQDRAEQGPAAR